MPREVVLLLLSFSCSGAIWPPAVEGYQRRTAAAVAVEGDAAVWKEYGFQEAERAEYARPGGSTKIVVTAWRLADATGATAAAQWLAGSELRVGRGAAVRTRGNYVVAFGGGFRPDEARARPWLEGLAGYQYGPAPTLPSFLPAQGRLAGRDRYLLGPASLAAFFPQIPATAAGFEPFQTEGQAAEYAGGTLIVFRFPTPAIAKGQMAEFQKLDGVRLKRSGPMVALVTGTDGAAPGGEAADRLLAGISFDVLYNYTETAPTQMPNVAGMIIAIFELAGLVILVGLGGGLLVAAALVYSRRGQNRGEDPGMTTLKLDS